MIKNNIVLLDKISDTTVLDVGIKGKYYIYYKEDNNLYMYDSFNDVETNLFNLDSIPANGDLIFNISKKDLGIIKFDILKKSNNKLNFNITKIDKGLINFAITKVSRGQLTFDIIKSPAVGNLLVNVKEVI